MTKCWQNFIRIYIYIYINTKRQNRLVRLKMIFMFGARPTGPGSDGERDPRKIWLEKDKNSTHPPPDNKENKPHVSYYISPACAHRIPPGGHFVVVVDLVQPSSYSLYFSSVFLVSFHLFIVRFFCSVAIFPSTTTTWASSSLRLQPLRKSLTPPFVVYHSRVPMYIVYKHTLACVRIVYLNIMDRYFICT